MTAINYSELRQYLKSSLDRVCEDHEPMIVTRRNAQNVVMLSQEDYESLEETAYLLRSPANARRIHESIQSFKKGDGQEKTLLDS